MADTLVSASGTDDPDRPDDEAVVLRRRTLVPTPRQVKIGEVAADEQIVVSADSDGETPPSRAGGRAGDLFRDMRLSAIEGPKLPILVLSLVGTIAMWDDAALGILLPEIQLEFGIATAFLVGLASLLGIVTKALAIPFGYAADRFSRVWIIRIGSLIANGASVIQGLAPGVGVLVGGRLLGGLGAASTQPASFPLLADYYKPSARARVFSFTIAGGLIGTVVGPLVVGVLGDRYGWRVAVISLGALATIVSLLTFLLREPKRGQQELIEAGVPEKLRDVGAPPPGIIEAYRTMGQIVTLRRLWFVAPLTILAGTGSVVILNIYYAEVFLIGAGTRGLIAGLSAGLGVIGLLAFGPIGDRMIKENPARLTIVAAVLTLYQAFSFAVLAFAPNAAVALVAGVPFGIVSAALFPAQLTLISMVVPARMRAIGLQTQAPFELIGLVAAPVLTAVAIGSFGLKLGMLLFALPLIPAAAIIASTAGHIEKDIRNAKREALAAAEATRLREEGSNNLLLIRDLEVGYDGVQVLFGVNLDVAEGELVALLGTNGAGKSTVLRGISGTQDPSAGAIFLDGRDITHLPPAATAELGVVMMPGGRAVFPDLTVKENLEAATWLYRGDPDNEARMAEVRGFFPALEPRMDQAAGTLSGGEQQMVALGQAFIMRPRLLMIDELSLGLAPQIVEQLLDILRKIHAAGTTIIIVEQSLNVAATVADRSVFMEKGEVRFDGPTDILLARPDLVRSVFIGGGGAGGSRRQSAAPTRDENAVPTLVVTDIQKSFGGVAALRGANLEVHAGEILGIIGPNGAGKTTLFDVISGFVTPDVGQVILEGQDVTSMTPDARSRAGLARSFQNARLFPTLTVRENIAVFLERQTVKNPLAGALQLPNVRKSESRIDQRVSGFIELLGLEAYADKFVGELSTGSRRIVDVAGVMAQHPRVLLLDEPTSGLAQAESEALGPLMTRIVRELGCAIIVIEHDVPLVTSVADRMIAMELGADLVTGTPDHVVGHPDVLRSYLSATENSLSRSGTRLDQIQKALADDASTVANA